MGGALPLIASLTGLSSTRTGYVLLSSCEMGPDLSIHSGSSRVAALCDSSACATPALAPGNELRCNQKKAAPVPSFLWLPCPPPRPVMHEFEFSGIFLCVKWSQKVRAEK